MDTPASAVPGRVNRREAVVGGVAGLLGLGAGAAAGRLTAAHPPPDGGGASVPAPAPAGPPHMGDAWPSYAQCGEDVLVAHLLGHYKIERPTYLDVGCWEPVRSNNTYLLYLLGGRGVLVEPNPTLADHIHRDRPEDKLVSAGIGVSDATEADYFILTGGQFNTFDPGQVKLLLQQPGVKLEKTIKVPLVNINRVVADHLGGRAPDVLSIDIEGLDLAVLRTLDYARYRPKLICAETLVTATDRHNPETAPFMAAQGYEVRGMTLANTVFVDKALRG